MPLVTPMSLTLSDGFVQWTRESDEVEISPDLSTAQQVTMINNAIADGKAIVFRRGGVYTDLPGFVVSSRIPYIAWYGDPALPRPVLRFLPSASYGFLLDWLQSQNTTSFLCIGIDFDGSNSGVESDYDDWVKKDFYCIRGKVNKGNSRTHNGLVFEDNIFRRWDTGIHLVDDNPRTQPAGTSGSIQVAIRRNMFLDMMGRDGHSLGIYGEGWADGSLVEQNFFDYIGYTASYGRDMPDFRTPSDPIADKRTHAMYLQQFGGEIVVRQNITRHCAAHGVQMRVTGICDDNVMFYCAVSTNTGSVLGASGKQSRINRNLFGHQVDISSVSAQDRRGQGIVPFYSPGGLECRQNILFDRQGTGTGGTGNGFDIQSGSHDANVLVDWWHKSGTKESNGVNVNVTGLGFKVSGDYYDIRATPGGLANVEQPPHAYDGNYQVPAPANYDSWPDITDTDAAVLRSRRLGEWRDVDHVSYYIDPARVLAKAAVNDEYSISDSDFDPITWSQTFVNNGVGGSQSDSPSFPGDGDDGTYDEGGDGQADPPTTVDGVTTMTATGDGTIRDADILAAAADALPDEDGIPRLHFSAGTYDIEQVIIPTKVRLTGEGATIRHATSSQNRSTDGLWLSGAGSRVDGLTFDRQDRDRMVVLNANNCSVSGNTFTGEAGTQDAADKHNVRVNEAVTGCTINGNTIENGELGVYLSRGTDNTTVSGNTIGPIQGQHGIYANHGADQMILNNTIFQTYRQGVNMQVDRAGGTMSDPVVKGNFIYNLTAGNGISFNCVTGLGNCTVSGAVVEENDVIGSAYAFRWSANSATDSISVTSFKNNSYADASSGASHATGPGTVTITDDQTTTRTSNREFYEDWSDTSAWTFDAGDSTMAAVASNKLTVTNTSGFGMTTTSDVLPTDKAYTVEFITTPDTGSVGGLYKWRIALITGTGAGTVRLGLYFDNTGLYLNDGSTSTRIEPPDWDGANTRVKITLWINPITLKARAFMWHLHPGDDELDPMRPYTGGSRATYEAQSAVEIDLDAAPTKIRLSTGGTNGVSTLEQIDVWPLGTPGQGTSLPTGSGEPHHSPVPDYRNDSPDGTLLEYMEQLDNTSVRYMNLGKGEDTLVVHLEPKIADFFCLSGGKFILWAGTNDIGSQTLAAMQTAMNSVISKARTASVKLYVVNMIPRHSFTSEQNEKLQQWNAWLSRRIPQSGNVLIPVWSLLKDPANSDHIATLYNDDNVHLTDEGYAVVAREVFKSGIVLDPGFGTAARRLGESHRQITEYTKVIPTMAIQGTFRSGSTASALKVEFTTDAPKPSVAKNMILIPGSGNLIGWPVRVDSMTDDGGGDYTITPSIDVPSDAIPASGDDFEMGHTDNTIQSLTE